MQYDVCMYVTESLRERELTTTTLFTLVKLTMLISQHQCGKVVTRVSYGKPRARPSKGKRKQIRD